MSTANKDYWDKLWGGSFLSKAFFILHWIVFISAVLLFITGHWKLGILAVIIALAMVFTSYRLAGGRRNPIIWEGEDLYDRLKHVYLSGDSKIGFHSLRDQKPLLDKIESIGIRKKPSEDIRQFIIEKCISNRKVFDILRDNIIIQMVHEGKEWYWDGYGNKTTAQYLYEAEIIFDLKPSVDYIFSEVLEGLKPKKSKQETQEENQILKGTRRWKTALLLSIFLGYLGIDRFYLGYVEKGILKLLTCGGFYVWWIMDIMRIATNSLRDAEGKKLYKE